MAAFTPARGSQPALHSNCLPLDRDCGFFRGAGAMSFDDVRLLQASQFDALQHIDEWAHDIGALRQSMQTVFITIRFVTFVMFLRVFLIDV